MRKKQIYAVWSIFALLILMIPYRADAHEVVGEVTPLMLHTNHVITFLKNDRAQKALHMARQVYQDFEEPSREGMEAGLKTNSERMDRKFGTNTHKIILTALEENDPKGLRMGLELLSFLLMLEKFDVLQKTFTNGKSSSKTQTTIFWLGRNYFSYLLEPAIGEKDPIEEKRLDRLLDRMLYSVEDRRWDQFIRLRKELSHGIIRFFYLPVQDDQRVSLTD